jgi:DNA-3-methyladenine glycosylase II
MQYLTILQKDKRLDKVLGQQEYVLEPKKHVAIQLMKSIMSQQLSTKVAAVIYNRFLALYHNKMPTNTMVAATSNDILRGIGLSNNKVSYVKNVAVFFEEHSITYAKLQKLGNEEIIAQLTQIKGVGKWTVEMLLMFTLAREDVFAVDDLGIQQAMIKLYKLPTDNKKILQEKMLTLSNKWKPYRTYACLHLWSWKDEK